MRGTISSKRKLEASNIYFEQTISFELRLWITVLGKMLIWRSL